MVQRFVPLWGITHAGDTAGGSFLLFIGFILWIKLKLYPVRQLVFYKFMEVMILR